MRLVKEAFALPGAATNEDLEEARPLCFLPWLEAGGEVTAAAGGADGGPGGEHSRLGGAGRGGLLVG